MLWRACMRAGHNIFQIALGLNTDRENDQEGHKPDHGEQDGGGNWTHDLHLLQLNERAIEILGMQEDHRLAVGPDFWLAIAQNTRPC